MLYKKSRLGTIYVHLLTSSPFPFLLLLGIGVAGFVLMTTSIKVDIIGTYPARLDICQGIITVDSKETFETTTIHAYSNRNETIVTLKITGTIESGERAIFHIDPASLGQAGSLDGKIYIDVPMGQETLLKRIVLKAGRNHE